MGNIHPWNWLLISFLMDGNIFEKLFETIFAGKNAKNEIWDTAEYVK